MARLQMETTLAVPADDHRYATLPIMGVRMRKLMAVLFLCIVTSGCETESSRQHEVSGVNRPQIGDANQAQERRIRELIQQLVFADRPANNQHVVNPNMKIVVDGTSTTVGGESEDADKRRQRFNVCLEAFNELYEMKPLAIPYLVEHLDDERQSIDFRNHYVGNSVGDACYWNIYYQLVDQPEDYSEYGWQREGRDGKDHPKPYWEGTPFGDLGDSEALKQWLKENRNLSYEEMQIKCLQWLLDRERLIGLSDADSYFLNILPLEIRILELRLKTYNKSWTGWLKSETNDLQIKSQKICLTGTLNLSDRITMGSG